MKRLITQARTVALAAVSLLAATVLAAAQAVTIQNQWTAAYITDANGLGLTADVNDPAAQWVFEPVDGTGNERIRNAATGNVLNVETGALQAGPTEPGWVSAQWARETADGQSFRFQSVWQQGSYLNVETGSLQAGPVEPGWLSALWIIAPATQPAMPAPAEAQMPSEDQQAGATEQPAEQPDAMAEPEAVPGPAAGEAQPLEGDLAAMPAPAEAPLPAGDEQQMGAMDQPTEQPSVLIDPGPPPMVEEAEPTPLEGDMAGLPLPDGQAIPDATPLPEQESVPDAGQQGLAAADPGSAAPLQETDALPPLDGQALPDPAATGEQTAAAAQPDQPLPSVQEATGQPPVQLVVQNRSGAPVEVFLGVPGGDPVYVQTVGPGQQLMQQSPASALWILAQNDGWVGDYQLSAEPVQIIQFP